MFICKDTVMSNMIVGVFGNFLYKLKLVYH